MTASEDGTAPPAAPPPDPPDAGPRGGPALPGALAEVLASIRTLVSAETAARLDPRASVDGVLMLTPEMRVEAPDDGPEDGPPSRAGEILAEGIGSAGRDMRPGAAAGQPAPILDEVALRGVINHLVREELQGELGERISRNLRKLIRREMAQLADERHDG